MKKTTLTLSGIFALSFIWTCIAFAQPAAPAAPTIPAAPAVQASPAPAYAPAPVRPNRALIPNLNQGYMNQHNSNLAVAQKGDIDLLFMGDSITDFWRTQGRGGKAVFDKNFGPLKTANFGIAGDTTQGVLWRLQNGEGQGFKPKGIMLMIGTNNTNASGANSYTTAEIAMGVAAVVYELRKDFPDAKILLLAIFPRDTPTHARRIKNTEINQLISALNDGQHVFFMDIGQKFLAPDGTIPNDIMPDLLHPSAKGYEIWADAVKDTLEGFLK
jgi:lysophospholipase L1-like esterase